MLFVGCVPKVGYLVSISCFLLVFFLLFLQKASKCVPHVGCNEAYIIAICVQIHAISY